jgi:hypothetical protein
VSYRTKPGYTADTQANITAQVPDDEDGAIAFAIAEQTAWQLSKTSVATVGTDVLATKSGTGRWLSVKVGAQSTNFLQISESVAGGASGSTTAAIAPPFDETWGTRYLAIGLYRPIYGVKIYWAGGAGLKTIKCSLYVTSAAPAVASANVNVDAAGIYEALFASPYTLAGNDGRQFFWVGAYNLTTPTSYTRISTITDQPTAPYICAPNVVYSGSYFIAGDGKPTDPAVTERYAADVIL